MIIERKHALPLSAALLSAALAVAGCSREVTTEAAENEAARAANEAARSAALATGATASALDDLVAANDALLYRIDELESKLARTEGREADTRVIERVVERPVRYESRDEAIAPERFPDSGAYTASAVSHEPYAYEPAYREPNVLADARVADDAWRTRTLRDVPQPLRREPARDVRRPEPTYRRLTVDAGTPFGLEILDPISTRYSQPGDRFRARLAGDLLADGRVAIRDGAEVTGRVVDVRDNRRIGGRPALAIELDRIELPDGSSAPIEASWSVRGKSQTPKDAATIGGATVGGAVLGRIFDKGEGELLGGLLGAAAGTAVARQKVGKPIVLDAGEVLDMTLDAPIEVRIRG